MLPHLEKPWFESPDMLRVLLHAQSPSLQAGSCYINIWVYEGVTKVIKVIGFEMFG